MLITFSAATVTSWHVCYYSVVNIVINKQLDDLWSQPLPQTYTRITKNLFA